MTIKGTKIIALIIMLFAVAAFAFGTVPAIRILTGSVLPGAGGDETLSVLLLYTPFLLSYLLFAVFCIGEIVFCIYLLRHKSIVIGAVLLTIALLLTVAAITLTLMVFLS